MKRLATTLLLGSLLLPGCTTGRIDREALDTLYMQTVMDGGARSNNTQSETPAAPRRLANWFYTGTHKGRHKLVYIQVTSDERGLPVYEQRTYTIRDSELKIASPMRRTSDSAKWVLLHEAAAGEVPIPTDSPSRFVSPDTLRPDNAQPETIRPQQRPQSEPLPQAPGRGGPLPKAPESR